MYHAQALQPEANPSIFGHFAAEWFPAMVDVLIGNTQAPQEAGVHYMLLDACVTFLGWDSLFPVPPQQEVANRPDGLPGMNPAKRLPSCAENNL